MTKANQISLEVDGEPLHTLRVEVQGKMAAYWKVSGRTPEAAIEKLRKAIKISTADR